MIYHISKKKLKTGVILNSESEIRVSDNVYDLINIKDPYINKKSIYEVRLDSNKASQYKGGLYWTKNIEVIRKVEIEEFINKIKGFKQFWDIQTKRSKLYTKKLLFMWSIALIPVILVLLYLIIPIILEKLT